MPDETRIRWTDATWNPMSGCTKLSPGCDNCYASTLAERYRGTPAFPVGFDPMLRPHKLKEPSRWKEPRRIFVNSMSDVFHRQWPKEYVFEVLDIMRTVDRHTYQVLTKRPKLMRDMIAEWLHARSLEWVPRNIWLGTSIENDDFVWRADVLREIPVDVRFLSCEPLLGPLPSLQVEGLQWIIVGGESGPGFRKMDHDWARDIRDRCVEVGVPFFFKQSSGIRTEMGIELDGELWEQFPE